MKTKLHKSSEVKRWWWNMNNIIINYHHIGEDNDMRFIHMNGKCRLDRIGMYSSVFRWRR